MVLFASAALIGFGTNIAMAAQGTLFVDIQPKRSVMTEEKPAQKLPRPKPALQAPSFKPTLKKPSAVVPPQQMQKTSIDICRLDNPLKFDSAEFKVDTIAERILDIRKSFTEKEVLDIKQQISFCQNQVDNQITNIKMDISELVSVKQNIMRNSDIVQLQEQIQKNLDNKDKIREELKNNLADLSYKGIYLAVIRYKSPFESKQKLSTMAESLIAEIAIRELNGNFIRSLSEVKNGVLVRDFIESQVSGEMGVEKNYISQTNPADLVYMYLSKVAVSPLKPHKIVSASGAGTDYQYKIFNLSNENHYQDELQQFGLTDQLIQGIVKQADIFLPTVQKENAREAIQESEAIRNTIAKLNDIDQKVLEVKEEIQRKQTKLSESYQNINFEVKGELLDSIDPALKKLTDSINTKKQELLQIKQNELLSKNSSVKAEGNPPVDIAKQSIALINQLVSSHAKIEKLLEHTLMEDGLITNYDLEREVSVIRSLDKFWIYIVPTDITDTFNILTVVKFKITEP